MVEVGTGGSKSRFIKRKWPVTEGLVAGTTKQEGRKTEVEPEESLINEKTKVGL